jgi:L-alanine-DL-glutamate epimerase-like enolase superfamily enzyme
MRIESVEAIPIAIPLNKDFGGSTYHVTKRCTVITRIRTSDGLVSEVYNGDNRDESGTIAKLIRDELAPILVGEDPQRIERLWEKMRATTNANRDRKIALEAIACVDTALWDLLGRACGVSVNRLLGGCKTEMPIISIAGYYEKDKTLADLSREMEWLRGVGMAGCKVKVGGLSPKEDAARVQAAREGAGEDFILVVDANRGWSPQDAIEFSRMIEHLDIRWFEEPCFWYDDVAMMARVRQATRIPINAGQSEITSQGVRRMLEARAVDFVNFDASEAGGITEWKRAAGMCAVFGATMAHHEEPHLAVHMLSGVAHGSYVECFANPERDPIWDRMIENQAPLKNGIIQVPTGPGFDLVLDQGMIEKYRLR